MSFKNNWGKLLSSTYETIIEQCPVNATKRHALVNFEFQLGYSKQGHVPCMILES